MYKSGSDLLEMSKDLIVKCGGVNHILSIETRWAKEVDYKYLNVKSVRPPTSHCRVIPKLNIRGLIT